MFGLSIAVLAVCVAALSVLVLGVTEGFPRSPVQAVHLVLLPLVASAGFVILANLSGGR